MINATKARKHVVVDKIARLKERIVSLRERKAKKEKGIRKKEEGKRKIEKSLVRLFLPCERIEIAITNVF